MKKAFLGTLTFAALAVHACGADPLYIDETDAVVTLRAEGSTFSSYRTYYLPGSIIDLCLQPPSGTPTSEAIGGAAGGPAIDAGTCFETDHSSDEAILDALEENMDALGYERVDDADSADLALLVGLVSKTSWVLSRAYCYPNAYFGGCVSGSGNPEIIIPGAGADSFSSVIVQMIDVAQSTEDDLVSLWTVAIHQRNRITEELGTSLGGGPSSVKQRILSNGIDQAFAQSKYLSGEGE